MWRSWQTSQAQKQGPDTTLQASVVRSRSVDERACVGDHSQSSPIAQPKSMPRFREVRRYKLIQLQRIAGREERVIEITDLLKEIVNVALIRETSGLCSAKSRSNLTQQFLRANTHGAARREHLARVFGNSAPVRGTLSPKAAKSSSTAAEKIEPGL